MADINDLMNQLNQLGAAIQNTASTINAAGSRTSGGIQSVGQNMARLRMEMQRGTGSVTEYAQQLRRVRAQYDGLEDQIKSSSAGQAMFAEQSRMAGQVMRQTMGEFAGAVTRIGITQALEYFKNQFFTTVRSLQDNVGGTATAFNLQNNALDAQIRTLNSLNESLKEATAVLALIPGWSRGLAALTGVGAIVAGLGSSFTELQKEGVNVLQTEIKKSEIAFNTMTASGAQFVQGFSEMRRVTANLRLDLSELSKFVVNNRETLANFGGTVQGGIKRFEGVSLEMGKFRKELVTLGYSYEDQAQGMADYMDMIRQSGQLQQMTDDQLAKGSRDYLFNLRAISALTGEDVKRAQARAREASTQLAVQSKLQGMGAGAMERFTAGIKNMEPFMQKALQEATAFDGTVIDKSLNQLFALSPARQRLFEETYQDTLNTALSADDITKRYQERVRQLGPALQSETASLGDSIGAANLAVGALPELTKQLEATLALGIKGQADLASQIPNTVEVTKQLSETQDTLRVTTAAVEVAFKNYQARLTDALTGPAARFSVEGAPGLPGFLANKGMLKQLDDAFGLTIAGLEKIGIVGERWSDKFFPELRESIGTFLDRSTNPFSRSADELSSAAGTLENAGQTLAQAGRSQNRGASFSDTSGTTPGYSLARAGEAVIPLSSGDNVAVDLRSPSGLIEGAFQKLQAEQGLASKSSESIQTAMQSLFNSNSPLTQTMADLKQQLATDNQASNSMMKEYIGKMDTLIAAMENNVDYSKRIADNIA